ncbi:MAG: hypothetical protein Q8P83_02425 [bacterium]|nr:hypothetical protein [bacterium]
MEEILNNKKLITTPDEAVDEFMGEQFIEWLSKYITHELEQWPQLKMIATAEFRPEKIKKFLVQKYLDSKAVWGSQGGDPGFLGFAIANLSESNDPAAETALSVIEQKYEEEKQGLSLNLWLKLFKELDTSVDELNSTEPKEPTRNYVSEFSDLYSTSEWQIVAGAMATYQIMKIEESKALLSLLQNNAKISNSGLEILKLSATDDDKMIIKPVKILEKIVFDKESKQQIWNGAKKQLEARKHYYEKLIKYLE